MFMQRCCRGYLALLVLYSSFLHEFTKLAQGAESIRIDKEWMRLNSRSDNTIHAHGFHVHEIKLVIFRVGGFFEDELIIDMTFCRLEDVTKSPATILYVIEQKSQQKRHRADTEK